MRQAAATTSAPSALQGVDAFADREAGGDDVLDDDHLLAGRDLEAAAELELAFDALGVDRRNAEVPGGLVAGDDAADGGRDDLGDVAKAIGADLLGQRPAELLGLFADVLEDLRLLQEDRRAQARATG